MKSYYPSFDGRAFYGSLGGKKLHLIGGNGRMQVAVNWVSQSSSLDLSIVVCVNDTQEFVNGIHSIE